MAFSTGISDRANGAELSIGQIVEAIFVIEERLVEFKRLNLDSLPAEEIDRTLHRLVASTNRCLRELFESDAPEFLACQLEPIIPGRGSTGQDTSLTSRLPDIRVRLNWAIDGLESLLEKLRDQCPTNLSTIARHKMLAWESLGLHPTIAQAAVNHYLAGSYVRAVQAAHAALLGHLRHPTVGVDARGPWSPDSALPQSDGFPRRLMVPTMKPCRCLS
jgi:hypothetical protein